MASARDSSTRTTAARLLAAAVFIFAGALAARAAEPLPRATLERMLLVDAARLDSRIVALGERGSIIVSDDLGATWQARHGGMREPLLTALAFADKQTGFAVGHDSLVLKTTDGGNAWSAVYSAPKDQRPLLDVLVVDKDLAIAVGAYGLYLETPDGGKSWSARKIIEEDRHLNSIARVGERLVIAGEAGTLLASDDRGRTWSPLASPYKGSFFGVVAADDGGLVIFGLRGRIFRSADRGATWTAVDNNATAALMGGTKLFDGTLVLAGNAGTVLVSRDHGRSFVPVMSGTTRTLAAAVAGAADKLLLFGEGGPREVALPFRRATP